MNSFESESFKGEFRNTGFRSSYNNSRAPLFALLVIVCVLFAISTVAIIFVIKRDSIPVPKTVASVIVQDSVAINDNEEILVPIKRIDPGQMLEQSMVKKIQIARASIPLGAVRLVEEVQGMYATTGINVNQPIVRGMLQKEPPVNMLSNLVTEGYRAVTININATTGVEGWARPGAYVDVQWISNASKGGGKGQAAIYAIVQNAKVLSAERRLDPQAPPGAPVPSTVTLLVTEMDARRISLTSTAGMLVLHMRGTGDKNISSTVQTLTVSDLLNSASDSAAASQLQGVVKLKMPDGSYKEWVVMEDDVKRRDKFFDEPLVNELEEQTLDKRATGL